MMLAGRSAIITGASHGLGREIAIHFIRNGASVLLNARGDDALRAVAAELEPLASPGQQVLRLCGDVSSSAICRKAAGIAREVLPPPHVLVNNAGVLGPLGRIEEVDWDAWIAAVQINLFGTVQMCRALVPLMRQHGYGKIINLSGGGATAPMPHISAYAASKAAVVRFTETLAHELSDTRIDVNAIAPGAMNTQFLDALLAAGPEKVGRENYERGLEQRRDGGVSPEKGANLAVFLASAQSDGITGRLISAVWDNWQGLPSHREQLARSDVYTLRRITPEDRGNKW